MKTENEFNSWLKKRLDRYKPDLQALKLSDRFQSGLSDFMILANGKCIFLETKFLKETPSDKALLLKHPFSPAQISFLGSVQKTGHTGLGAVGFGDSRRIAIINRMDLKSNWKTGDFLPLMTTKWVSFSELLGVATASGILEVFDVA